MHYTETQLHAMNGVELRDVQAALGVDQAEVAAEQANGTPLKAALILCIMRKQAATGPYTAAEPLTGTAPSPAQPPTAPAPAADALTGALATAIAPVVAGMIKAQTADEIQTAVDKAVREQVTPVTHVKYERKDGSTIDLSGTHKTFPLLLEDIHHTNRPENPRVPLLWGAPGGGKTHACAQAAKALGVPFFPIAFSEQTTKSELFGFFDAHGKPIETILRQGVQSGDGALFLLDEIDHCMAGVAAALNMMMAQREALFPDKRMELGWNVYFVAASNTRLLGPEKAFPAAKPQSDATRDRFSYRHWTYDNDLEARLATAAHPHGKEWAMWCWKARDILTEEGAPATITPRVIMDGAMRMNSKVYTDEDIANAACLDAMSDDHRRVLLHRNPIPRLTRAA